MKGRVFTRGLSSLGTLLVVTVLAWVVFSLTVDGLAHWHWWVLVRPPRELLAGGGIGPEIENTVAMVGTAEGISLLLGLSAAVWRGEFAGAGPLGRLYDRLVLGMQSLPTIVAGLVVFQILIQALGWPLSVGSGAVTLALINWPVAARAGQLAFGRVPGGLRDASAALGASRTQTFWRLVVPMSLAELADQTGLAWARLSGEAAALVFTAGINVGPRFGWFEPGETLAVHFWYIRMEGLMPDRAALAAQTGVVLLAMTVIVVLAGKWVARQIGGGE